MGDFAGNAGFQAIALKRLDGTCAGYSLVNGLCEGIFTLTIGTDDS